MDKPYYKADLVAELAQKVGISKRKSDFFLKTLAEIAYREAPRGFNVPGICRLDIVHRNERRARIPTTGEQILIGAHDTLRVRPLRKAKNTVTPRPEGLVQYIDTAPEAGQGGVAPDATPHRAPALQGDNPEHLVSFKCSSCGQEIEAPNDMSGSQAECPTCGNGIEIPYISEPGTIWGRPAGAAPPPPVADQAGTPQPEPASDATLEAMKGRTIRIELPDDL